MSGRRLALLVASDQFADTGLRGLLAPLKDVELLRAALADEQAGQFRVVVSINEPAHIIRRQIGKFFRDAGPDDVALLYLTTHGVKDEYGHLYFAACDTEIDNLQPTTVESEFIHKASGACRARAQLLVFDACYSGAFGKGVPSKDAGQVIKEDLVGEIERDFAQDVARGVVILTAATSFQYAFEDGATAQPPRSVFTKHLVDGIATGAADLNGDGWISEDELYKYVFTRTRAERPAQTPQRWVVGAVGEMRIARARRKPVPGARPGGPLPAELVEALESPLSSVRQAVVGELAALANAGTLAAFTAVSVCMLIMRRRAPDAPRTFRAPMPWVVGGIAVLGCIYLFFSLPAKTQLWFLAWNIGGLGVYFLYARSRAVAG